MSKEGSGQKTAGILCYLLYVVVVFLNYDVRIFTCDGKTERGYNRHINAKG